MHNGIAFLHGNLNTGNLVAVFVYERIANAEPGLAIAVVLVGALIRREVLHRLRLRGKGLGSFYNRHFLTAHGHRYGLAFRVISNIVHRAGLLPHRIGKGLGGQAFHVFAAVMNLVKDHLAAGVVGLGLQHRAVCRHQFKFKLTGIVRQALAGGQVLNLLQAGNLRTGGERLLAAGFGIVVHKGGFRGTHAEALLHLGPYAAHLHRRIIVAGFNNGIRRLHISAYQRLSRLGIIPAGTQVHIDLHFPAIGIRIPDRFETVGTAVEMLVAVGIPGGAEEQFVKQILAAADLGCPVAPELHQTFIVGEFLAVTADGLVEGLIVGNTALTDGENHLLGYKVSIFGIHTVKPAVGVNGITKEQGPGQELPVVVTIRLIAGAISKALVSGLGIESGSAVGFMIGIAGKEARQNVVHDIQIGRITGTHVPALGGVGIQIVYHAERMIHGTILLNYLPGGVIINGSDLLAIRIGNRFTLAGVLHQLHGHPGAAGLFYILTNVRVGRSRFLHRLAYGECSGADIVIPVSAGNHIFHPGFYPDVLLAVIPGGGPAVNYGLAFLHRHLHAGNLVAVFVHKGIADAEPGLAVAFVLVGTVIRREVCYRLRGNKNGSGAFFTYPYGDALRFAVVSDGRVIPLHFLHHEFICAGPLRNGNILEHHGAVRLVGGGVFVSAALVPQGEGELVILQRRGAFAG